MRSSEGAGRGGPDRRGESGQESGRRARASGHLPPRTFRQRAAPGRAGTKGTPMTAIPARLAAASGAFFVVALLVGNGLAAPASRRSPTARRARDLQRDPPRRIGFVLEVLGFPAFLVFLGYVYRVLRRAEGPDGWAAASLSAPACCTSPSSSRSQRPVMVGFYRGDELTPELARTLVDLNGMAFVVSGLLLGSSARRGGRSCLAHRVLPRWLGWSGVVVGVLAVAAGVVGIVAADSYNPLPFLGGLALDAGLSVMLTVARSRRTARSVRDDPGAGGRGRRGVTRIRPAPAGRAGVGRPGGLRGPARRRLRRRPATRDLPAEHHQPRDAGAGPVSSGSPSSARSSSAATLGTGSAGSTSARRRRWRRRCSSSRTPGTGW